uniref:Putative capsid protein n=1 Tax=viral metagenome TaxID=1070528 RepID=A0A6H1ZJT7_9ZZZZ
MPITETLDRARNIYVSTLRAKRKTIIDNIHSNNPLLNEMLQRGRIVEEDGGSCIEEPIEFGINPNTAWIGDYGTLGTAAPEFLVNSKTEWKVVGGLVVVSDIQLLKNQGKHQLIKLIDAKKLNLQNTLKGVLSAGIFSNGTGSGGLQLTGLQAAVADDPTTGIYAGIDRASYSWWRNQQVSGGVFSTDGLANLRTQTLRAADDGGKDRANLYVAGQTPFEEYLKLGDPRQRIPLLPVAATKRLIDMGFDVAEYMRTPVIWDTDCANSRWYGLNLNYMKLTVCRGGNFAMTPSVRAFNSPQAAYIVFFMANLVLTQPRRQFVMHTIS